MASGPGSPCASAPDEDNESTISSNSTTSTDFYAQEPFGTFCLKVLKLANDTIWPEPEFEAIQTNYMEGGLDHRIVGITRRRHDFANTTNPPVDEQFILRTPRYASVGGIQETVATLSFLKEHTTIPVPRVEAFDASRDNILDRPYTIQNLVSGTALISAYPKLSHSGRCRVATELGGIFKQMLETRCDMAGKLTLAKNGGENEDGELQYRAMPLLPRDPSLSRPYSNGPPSQSTHDLLTSILLAEKADDDPEQFGNDDEAPWRPLWDKFLTVTQQLEECGWLADRHYYCVALTNLEFKSHNILANTDTDDPNAPMISVVLDWDYAVFAPAFVACQPPMWLWAWKDDEDEDEGEANEVPETPERQEIKRLFEEAAGEDYAQLSYPPA